MKGGIWTRAPLDEGTFEIVWATTTNPPLSRGSWQKTSQRGVSLVGWLADTSEGGGQLGACGRCPKLWFCMIKIIVTSPILCFRQQNGWEKCAHMQCDHLYHKLCHVKPKNEWDMAFLIRVLARSAGFFYFLAARGQKRVGGGCHSGVVAFHESEGGVTREK